MSNPVIRMTRNMWQFEKFRPFHIVYYTRKIHCCNVIIKPYNNVNKCSFYVCEQFFGSSSAHGKSV